MYRLCVGRHHSDKAEELCKRTQVGGREGHVTHRSMDGGSLVFIQPTHHLIVRV